VAIFHLAGGAVADAAMLPRFPRNT
jgi:hypothetical protein